MKIREKKKGAQGKKQKNKYSLRTRLRGWFHHGRFIGFDIQSIIMAVLTGLTITTTVVMGFLIYNRFKLAIKQTAVSNAESMIETTLAGLVVVLSILVKQISALFVTIKSLFSL